MGEWFERSFGTDYMVVYKHRNWEQANREIRQLCHWMGLPAGTELLDVGCGMGRHALALEELGYKVSGMDLSEPLLAEARRHDEEQRVRWFQGDMRKLPFADGSFDATVNLFTSFGYFEEEDENMQVLRELRRVIRPGGRFVIDFLNATHVARTLVPLSERMDEETGWTIREERRIEAGAVCKTITIQAGTPEERHYEERVMLFGREWFEQALAQAGLRLERVAGQYDGSPYDAEQSMRLIMCGTVAQ
ncbi:class I SAM-dependent methyltransferase [Paenibacillus sp. MMS18-CY102]|uniref:class I SAM-dependent methyltransferase n=1 Tax=Paenibacillus sp. MMS18-CY102 TaxID=2682849 RepID=UPI0013656434|nr:class I SAM-dependent methyltransferase [Paenibacillus sp. MMS18-CY102]MWC28689.1 methyltransferase domain-containing protein [Paenibacillus sp. MMS18-CY102]